MNLHYLCIAWAGSLLVATPHRAAGSNPSDSDHPSVPTILQRTVAQGKNDAGQGYLYEGAYTQSTVFEEFDGRGQIKKRSEKLYAVDFPSGIRRLTEAKINGSPLSPSELKQEEDRETRNRRRFVQVEPGQEKNGDEGMFTADLAEKYHFTWVGRDTIDGRPMFVLDFEPKLDPPIRHPLDRLLNHLKGRVWIDAREYEIARAEIHLQTEVNLWGGILASLQKFTFTVNRSRAAPAMWYVAAFAGDFDARTLFGPLHVRVRSSSSNFHWLRPESADCDR
ncbi:MAG: hypothetical protein M1608_12750 [Candidatus Omnitrophica bacterium]|nr:hypothetical protein [Candidatus Omnitrophota bacterium]